jgi:hypothetical protein
MSSAESPGSDHEVTNPGPSRWWHKLWLYLSVIAGALTILIRISDPVRQWLPGELDIWLPVALLAGAALGAMFFTEDGRRAARSVYRALQHFSPLGTVLTLVLIALLLLQFRLQFRTRGPQPVIVTMDPTRGALFNSWDEPKPLIKRIRVRGAEPSLALMWLIDGDSARFTFEVDRSILKGHPNASSGGYMTFYDTPVRRGDYNHVDFDSRATDAAPGCVPDLGVRLAADGAGRELATYELASVVQYFGRRRKLDGNWQRFEIYMPDLAQVRVDTAPTPGIDQNTLNKIAFYVSDTSAQHCSRATLWVKNIVFRP